MARAALPTLAALLVTAFAVLPAPASATLAPHAVAAGPVSVTYVAEVIDVCVGTLGVAAVAIDSITGSFVVEVAAAIPQCSFHGAGLPGSSLCVFAQNGDVRCEGSWIGGYMELTLSAGGAFHFTSMGPNSWTVFGNLVRA